MATENSGSGATQEIPQRIIELSLIDGAKNQCLVTKLQGEESLAGLFQFWVEVVLMEGAVPSIESDAQLTLKYSELTGGGRHALKERVVNGFIASVVQLPHDMRDRSHPRRRFRLLIVPHLWLATQHSNFFTHQDAAATSVIADMAGRYSTSCETSTSDSALDFIVQYGEKDWDFIARHCEALGYAHWVDDDNKLHVKNIVGAAGDELIGFRGEDSEDARFDWASHANVFQFNAHYRSGATTFQQQHWNQKTAENKCFDELAEVPALSGKNASKDIAHFLPPFNSMDPKRTEEEVKAASIAILDQRQIFRGSSDARSFLPGYSFELSAHKEQALNASYTIVAIQHEAIQDFSPGAGETVSARYRNSFSCIAQGQKWAPQRITPMPPLPGLLTATVSNLDDPEGLGRYQVEIPVPTADVSILSPWIRCVQRFASADIGDQAPLALDTEVALSFANGNVDQPIIIGALHNGVQKIPSKVIYGEEDTEIELIENRKAEHYGIFSGKPADRQQLFIDQTPGAEFVDLRAAGGQELLLDASNKKVQLHDGTHEHWLEFDQGKKTSRFGSGDKTDKTKQQVLECDEGNKILTLRAGSEDDMLIEAGKNQITTVEGDQEQTIQGDQKQNISGKMTLTTDGNHEHSAAEHTLKGDSKITLKVGGSTIEISSSSVTVTLGTNSVELTNSGVTVKGTTINVEGTAKTVIKAATVEVKADGMCTVESSGMCTVKGSMLTLEGSGVCSVKGGMIALG